MSIEIVNNVSLGVPAHNLQKVMYDRELIAQLARQLVACQVEAHIEMGRDFGDEYDSFVAADGFVQGAKDTVVDYFEDLVAEFRENVLAAMKDVKITTKSVTLSDAGFEDAVVSVE